MSSNVVPNFFIVGAPRCGTTSLAAYLMAHPQIYMPGTWEFNYLSDDLDWNSGQPIRSDADYLKSFARGIGYLRVGEKSAFYLYSRRAARRIHDLSPSAKIICMFRNPVDVVWSLYRYNLQNAEESIGVFEDALAAEMDRRAGRRIPKTTTIRQNLYYRGVVGYAEQLRRYLDLFGEPNVHVILFDSFFRNTKTELCRVQSFLGVDSRVLAPLPPQNQVGDLSLLRTRRALARYPLLKEVVQSDILKPVRARLRRGVGALLRGGPRNLKAIDPKTRDRLTREFCPEVERLGRLIAVNLSDWCR